MSNQTLIVEKDERGWNFKDAIVLIDVPRNIDDYRYPTEDDSPRQYFRLSEEEL